MTSIVIDLDHTLVQWDVPFWFVAADIMGIDRREFPHPTQYGLSNYEGEALRIIKNLFVSEWFMCDAVIPIRGSRLFLEWCCGQYEYIEIITCRHMRIAEATKAMVRRLFPSVAEKIGVRVLGSGTKAAYLARTKTLPDVFVDDSEVECEQMSLTGENVRIYMPLRVWNHDKTVPRVERVLQLTDVILSEVRRLEGGTDGSRE